MLAARLEVLSSPTGSAHSQQHRRAPGGRSPKPTKLGVEKVAPSTGNDDDEGDSGRESEDGVEDELDVLWRQRPKTDLPSEYWQIRKLLKYARAGNGSVTVISLCVVRDFDPYEDINQRAMVDERGVELLLNILETTEQRCKMAALKILKALSTIGKFRQLIVAQLGVESLVRALDDSFFEVKRYAAETLANLTNGRRARDLAIHNDAVERLVSLLDVKGQAEQQLDIRRQRSSSAEAMTVAGSAALALAVISRSPRSRLHLINAGVVPLIAHLLRETAPTEVLIPVIETLQNCSSEDYFREAILQEDIVKHLLHNINNPMNVLLTTHCANTILKAVEHPEIKTQVRQLEGLFPLVKCMSQGISQDGPDRQLLAAVTGAIWKCAEQSQDNVNELQALNVVDELITILIRGNDDDDILCNVVGGLAECLNKEHQRAIVSKRRAIPHLVQLLAKTNRQILINTSKTIIQCSSFPENMRAIEEADGIRHLWSLMKNDDPDVQADAAEAIHACIDQAPHISELVRNFVGGLELLVNLLSVPQLNVQSSVCGVIAAIAKDLDNLAIITDNGAVVQLARLASNGVRDYKLQRYLAEAVANCCALEANGAAFGKVNAVVPLVNYLKSNDEIVRKMAARALALLSRDAANCVVMHQNDAVKILLALCGSSVEAIQEDSATTLGNIRKVATMVN